jgi:hypothetical protein
MIIDPNAPKKTWAVTGVDRVERAYEYEYGGAAASGDRGIRIGKMKERENLKRERRGHHWQSHMPLQSSILNRPLLSLLLLLLLCS